MCSLSLQQDKPEEQLLSRDPTDCSRSVGFPGTWNPNLILSPLDYVHSVISKTVYN